MQILRVRFARHYRVIHTHLDRFVICDRPTDRPRYYYIRFRLKAFFFQDNLAKLAPES